MNRPVRRYVEKYAALDLSAGIYQTRKLPRARYNRADFMEYLSVQGEDLEEFEADFLLSPEDEDLE